MRIFERLRRRDQSDSHIERQLFETIAVDLLRRVEEGTAVTSLPEGSLRAVPQKERSGKLGLCG